MNLAIWQFRRYRCLVRHNWSKENSTKRAELFLVLQELQEDFMKMPEKVFLGLVFGVIVVYGSGVGRELKTCLASSVIRAGGRDTY